MLDILLIKHFIMQAIVNHIYLEYKAKKRRRKTKQNKTDEPNRFSCTVAYM